jgi:hypothetical protein
MRFSEIEDSNQWNDHLTGHGTGKTPWARGAAAGSLSCRSRIEERAGKPCSDSEANRFRAWEPKPVAC